ncbi:MAG: mismatch repair protein MutL [Chthoniobacteraceae bacterium]|nr:mismatch repair protein MutL [Chthoniobacteraceae bacterium]
MSRIALLAEEVASQVAAGEVVERPASVIKELVENSIDAEATRIEVLVRRGGISYMRVVDNGVGMDRDDALLCLERHATSKIRTGHDLAAIATLGFRGEALPSIASVSRFRLATREREALAGSEVIVSGGKIESVRDGGDAPGTQIEVRSLFYNLPARRKFLRTENTEASHVEHQLHLQAIGHPRVGFVFIKDDRVVYQLPPTNSLRERIRDLCGGAFATELLEVPEFVGEGIEVRGFIGKAGMSRSSRQQQLVFLNGRAVENNTLSFALREGYHTALMKGQHPVTFLFIQMDPAAVDVNVHPAKREVRFRDAANVREAVAEAVRRTIETDRAQWTQTFRASPGAAIEPLIPTQPFQASLPIPQSAQVSLRHDWASQPLPPPVRAVEALAATPALPPAPMAPAAPQEAIAAGEFRILGVLGKLYLLMENASGLVLVDQHAAHERILFEEMRRRMEEQGVPSQRLLIPLTMQVTPRDADWLLRHLEVLERAGIALEPFGSCTFKIDTLPTFLRASDPSQLVRDIIDDLRDTSTQTSKLRLGEEMIAKTVCRHAVKANDYLREPELVRLVQDLLACELPYCCPHGRPTMIQMSYGELEKKFGRKV